LLFGGCAWTRMSEWALLFASLNDANTTEQQ
jgi:hypothetical protein